MLDPRSFRDLVERAAGATLIKSLGSEAGKRSALRFGLAFATAARTAKNPDDFYRCSDGSIAGCVALSIETGLMPGGAMPAVWLIPRGGELQWMPSHRGLIQLAQSAGYQVRAVPVTSKDSLRIEFGEVVELVQDPDSWPDGLGDLRGVAIFATRIEDGARFGSAWVPAAAIAQRASLNAGPVKSGPVWKTWPVEMAIKTALRFVFARGYIPVASIEMDAALATENVIEAEATEIARATATTPTARQTLGLPAPDDIDPLDGINDRRDAIPVESEQVEQIRNISTDDALIASVAEFEAAALDKHGTAAVARAREKAGIDPESDVNDLPTNLLRAYRLELRSL